MKVVTVIGNRPQFVKAAAVSRVLRAEHDEVLVHTGQHHDDELSTVFVTELGVPRPERILSEMASTELLGDHGDLTAPVRLDPPNESTADADAASPADDDAPRKSKVRRPSFRKADAGTAGSDDPPVPEPERLG